MKELFDWIKRKYLCIRYGKKECADCKYCYDKQDWWGCTLNLRNYRK